jgi:hypothetical protein
MLCKPTVLAKPAVNIVLGFFTRVVGHLSTSRRKECAGNKNAPPIQISPHSHYPFLARLTKGKKKAHAPAPSAAGKIQRRPKLLVTYFSLKWQQAKGGKHTQDLRITQPELKCRGQKGPSHHHTLFLPRAEARIGRAGKEWWNVLTSIWVSPPPRSCLQTKDQGKQYAVGKIRQNVLKTKSHPRAKGGCQFLTPPAKLCQTTNSNHHHPLAIEKRE